MYSFLCFSYIDFIDVLQVFTQCWSEYANLRVDLNMQISGLVWICKSCHLLFQMSVPKLFNKFAVESLVPSSLSLMHWPPGAQNVSEINLSPMEISTFRIRLRWNRLPSVWSGEALALLPSWFLRAITKHITLASGYWENMNSVIFF